MIVLKGISNSPEIIKGIACLYSNSQEESLPHYNILPEHIENEQIRLKNAFEKTRESLEKNIKKSNNIIDEQMNKVISAHLSILNDASLYDKIVQFINEKKINAEHAINDVFEDYKMIFQQKQQHFKELIHDIEDIKVRLLVSMGTAEGHFECPIGERQPVIVVSKILVPSMILQIPMEHVLAFVVLEGGYTTHATILAHSRNIPVIWGIDVSGNVKCGDKLIVDGSLAKVIVNPDIKTQKYYDIKIKKQKERKSFCELNKSLPAQTKKKDRILLKVNISTSEEIALLKGLEYDGIGLLRTEFLFKDKTNPPTEEEQFNMYRFVLENVANRSVIARFLDIGSDKIPSYIKMPQQINPDLEIRGSRAVELFYPLYLNQAKAFLRAAKYGDLKILFPMVSDGGDIEIYQKLLSNAGKELKKTNKEYKENVSCGIMMETPASAILAEELLKRVDFANIGSNDLLQYVLAASRGNPMIEKRYHILHPALIKFIEMIIKTSKKLNKEVCLCGEIASFDEYYPLLLKIGLKSFSVSLSKFSTIKCELLQIDKIDNTVGINDFYSLYDKNKIEEYINKT